MYFQKYHFNLYEFGIVGKLVKSSVNDANISIFFKSRQAVPFVVLGHIFVVIEVSYNAIVAQQWFEVAQLRMLQWQQLHLE